MLLAGGAGGVWTFYPQTPLAQCVNVWIGTDAGAPVSVTSIMIGAVEQLLGEGVPAEFFGQTSVQLDRQAQHVPLTVILHNDGAAPTWAEVQVEFIAVEQLELEPGKLH